MFKQQKSFHLLNIFIFSFFLIGILQKAKAQEQTAPQNTYYGPFLEYKPGEMPLPGPAEGESYYPRYEIQSKSSLPQQNPIEVLGTPLPDPLSPDHETILVEATGPKPVDESLTKWSLLTSFGIGVHNSPVSKYSKNAFAGNILLIGAQKKIGQSSKVKGSLDFFNKKDATSSSYVPILKESFWEKTEAGESRFLRIGNFLSPAIVRERAFWPGFKYGPSRSGAWEKYGYNNGIDSGFEYGSLDPSSQPTSSWSFGVINIDGTKAEIMTQKELFFLWEKPVNVEAQNSFFTGILLSKGWYEGLPATTNNKDRVYVWLGQKLSSGWHWSLQGMNAADAVDGMGSSVADGAELITQIGKVAYASSLSFITGVPFSWQEKKYNLSLKVENLDPDSGLKNNSLQSQTLFLCTPEESGEICLSYENMFHESQHSLGPQNKANTRLDLMFQF